MEYTNTDQAKRLIEYYQKKRLADTRANSQGGYSISGLFSFLRKQPQLNPLGDYVLLWAIVDSLRGKMPQDLRKKLFYAVSRSSELSPISMREKRNIVETLVEVAK